MSGGDFVRKIMFIALLLAGVFPLLPNNASAAPKYQNFVDWLRKDRTRRVRHFLCDGDPYSVFVRSEKISDLLKSEYSYADIEVFYVMFFPLLLLPLKKEGGQPRADKPRPWLSKFMALWAASNVR
jgi:hypothetical protein